MNSFDLLEWAEAYGKEYQGFIEQGTLKIARPEKGAQVLDTTTRADYKVTNGVFDKRKIRLCVCGNLPILPSQCISIVARRFVWIDGIR